MLVNSYKQSKCFTMCASHSAIHTLVAEPCKVQACSLGALWGSVSCSRTLWWCQVERVTCYPPVAPLPPVPPSPSSPQWPQTTGLRSHWISHWVSPFSLTTKSNHNNNVIPYLYHFVTDLLTQQIVVYCLEIYWKLFSNNYYSAMWMSCYYDFTKLLL